MTVLLPVVLVECVLAVRQRRLTIFHYAFVACLPVLLVIYSDMGADTNHLLDFVVLAIPLMGAFLAAIYRSSRDAGTIRIASAFAVGWLLYISWANSADFPSDGHVAAFTAMTVRSRWLDWSEIRTPCSRRIPWSV